MNNFLLIYGPMKVMFYKRSSFHLKVIRKCKNKFSQLVYLIGRYFLIQSDVDKFNFIDITTMKKV